MVRYFSNNWEIFIKPPVFLAVVMTVYQGFSSTLSVEG